MVSGSGAVLCGKPGIDGAGAVFEEALMTTETAGGFDAASASVLVGEAAIGCSSEA